MPALRIKIKRDDCPNKKGCLFNSTCQDKRMTAEEVDGKYFRHGGSGAPLMCPTEAVTVIGSAELGPVVLEKTDRHPELRIGHEVKFGEYIGTIVPVEEAEATPEWGGGGLKEGHITVKLEEPFKDRSYFGISPESLTII